MSDATIIAGDFVAFGYRHYVIMLRVPEKPPHAVGSGWPDYVDCCLLNFSVDQAGRVQQCFTDTKPLRSLPEWQRDACIQALGEAYSRIRHGVPEHMAREYWAQCAGRLKLII